MKAYTINFSDITKNKKHSLLLKDYMDVAVEFNPDSDNKKASNKEDEKRTDKE